MLTLNKYSRQNAIQYALQYCETRNPKYFDYSDMGGNCTNFASQCLFAGAPVMNFEHNGWFYISPQNTSISWANVEPLFNFLTSNQGVGVFGKQCTIQMCEIGDIIQLKFKNKPSFSHCVVVTKINQASPKEIYVCANSRDVKNVPLTYYNYEKMRLIHILGYRMEKLT